MGSIAVCVDPHPFSRQVGTGAELFELGEEGFVDRLVGHGDGAEDVALCWCVVGDGEFAGVSKSTSMMALDGDSSTSSTKVCRS